MYNQIIGLFVGIALGQFIGNSITIKSKKTLLLAAFLIPLVLWLLVSFFQFGVSYDDGLENSFDTGLSQFKYKSNTLSVSEQIFIALGKGLGKFTIGFIALGISFYRANLKITKKKNNNPSS